MKTTRILIALTALTLTSCSATLAYINEDVAGHEVAASATLEKGKPPAYTIAATKRGIKPGRGK